MNEEYHLTLALIKLDPNGVTSFITSTEITLTDPSVNLLANQFPGSDLMEGDSPGEYRLQIEDQSSILAHVDFTYIG